MQVYRLEPKGGDTRDPNWAATTLKFKCWVLADSEDNARQAVMLATGIGARIEPGQPIPTSPWLRRDLTDCIPDKASGHEPPFGVILTLHGTITVPEKGANT